MGFRASETRGINNLVINEATEGARDLPSLAFHIPEGVPQNPSPQDARRKKVYNIYTLESPESPIFPSFPGFEALDEMQMGITRENVSVGCMCVSEHCV